MLDERHQQILEILVSQGQVSVVELSGTFDVSPVTIRTDLNRLAAMGKVVRTHGGARLATERIHQELTYATRQQINAGKKRCIGETAAALVSSGDAIILDSSTTAVAVGQTLKQRGDLENLTVVTTGIWAALELLGTPHIHVILTGGHVRDTTGSITGTFTEDILSRINLKAAFLGAWGLTLGEGATDTHLAEVELKTKIIARSQAVHIVVDGSKFGRLALASYASLDQINGVITDESAPDEMIAELRSKGIEVLIACKGA